MNDLTHESLNPLIWDYLLDYIDAGEVVIIVGPELMEVEHEGRKRMLTELAAEKLAERLDITLPEGADPTSLNDVVCCYKKSGRWHGDVYKTLQIIFRELSLPVPEPLRKLARIRRVKLFVTITFDPLLRLALEQERPEGRVEMRSYAPNDAQDLPSEVKSLDCPLIYHLLGRLSASPNFVVTDEDLLEFLCAMQDPAKRPPLLFDELRRGHLLMIGCSFPDWVVRLFMRTAHGDRLSKSNADDLKLKVLATNRVNGLNHLVAFLEHFSKRTEVLETRPTAFVDELWARYEERHGADAPDQIPVNQPASESPGAGVFLSYASEDLAAAESIRAGLDAAGIDVWLDKRKLGGGDEFDAKIKRNVRNCLLFLPVISATTEKRPEGYFRLEWDLAVERARRVAATIPFIVPIAIDDVPKTDALVPPKFLETQWHFLPGGKPTEDFVQRIVRLVRERQKREKSTV